MHRRRMMCCMSAWVDQIFTVSMQANVGGVVRRARYSVDEHHGAMDEIIATARDRGFHVVETGDQVVVLCHQGDLTIHC